MKESKKEEDQKRELPLQPLITGKNDYAIIGFWTLN